MTADRQTAYRFSRGVHWNACLLSQEDPAALDADEGIRPVAPFDRAVGVGEPSMARAPAVTKAGEVLWTDGCETLFRLAPCENEPDAFPAPESLARADRILATSSGLWVVGPSGKALECFDEQTLARLRIVELADDAILDIADPGDGSLLALVKRAEAWLCRRVSPSGRVLETIPLEGLEAPEALIALGGDDPKIVTLDGGPFQRLSWYSSRGGRPPLRVPIGALRPCFQALALGRDGRNRVLLVGVEESGSAPRGWLILHNAAGERCGDAPLEARGPAFTGVAGGRREVYVAGPDGLSKLPVADRVPTGGEVSRALATPALFSRDRGDGRRWLRAEAKADLPQGTTMEIAWAATDDDAVRDRLQDLLSDSSIPAEGRIDRLLNDPELRRGRISFQGRDRIDAKAPETFAAKLFDVRERHLWITVKLAAGGGARLPTLKELAVLYPGDTLMRELPAVHQRQEENPNGFLRSLVGVLETTTQSLDARIGSLSHRLDPSTASAEWLDFVARWLGVPWDDAFSEAQKRAVLGRAAELLQHRGARRGLETLLSCLFPGPGPRFRVIDATADHGFAALGGGARPGSRLPALLSAAPPPSPPKLDGTARLDSARLSGSGKGAAARTSPDRVRVDVAATPKERAAWSPWLLDVLRAMTPLTARLELRWVVPDASRMRQLDQGMILEPPRAPLLDSGAAVDRVRLPGDRTELSNTGRPLGGRLSLPGSDPHES